MFSNDVFHWRPQPHIFASEISNQFQLLIPYNRFYVVFSWWKQNNLQSNTNYTIN